MLTPTKPGVYLRAATKVGKNLLKKLCYFSHSYWKSFCFTLVDAKSNSKYPYFNWKKFSLLLQRTISLKHARKRLFWVYLWEPARSVQLLPVQLEIRFIYIYAFLIPTLFLFQFLKFTEYQAVHTRDVGGQNIRRKMSNKNGKLLRNLKFKIQNVLNLLIYEVVGLLVMCIQVNDFLFFITTKLLRN